MEKIWKCKIGGKVGDMPAGADGPMRRAVQTAFETLTGVEASFTFSGWGATLTEGERAVHENRTPNWDAMQEAIGAGDGTLHGAIEYWHAEALRLRAELAQCQQEMQQIRQMGDTIPLPVCEAYGELWMTVTKNKRINRARHLLVSCMTMEERKAGMRLAMKAHNNATPAPITARKGEGE